MTKTLKQHFETITSLVSCEERDRNPKLRVKELWLKELCSGMDKVIQGKPRKVLNGSR
jgi:hypothetical protein